MAESVCVCVHVHILFFFSLCLSLFQSNTHFCIDFDNVMDKTKTPLSSELQTFIGAWRVLEGTSYLVGLLILFLSL